MAYFRWKREIELLRNRLKTNTSTVLRNSRLVALTTCAAVFWTEVLNEVAPFDYVVFDEASQVNMAYALALSTFGKRTLFAGDPKQLAPIVQSEHLQARRWIGRSPFDVLPQVSRQIPTHAVFLNEQSRMRQEICEVVSRLFYGGRLQVAAKENADSGWHRERSLNHADAELKIPVSIVPVTPPAVWSARFRGPIRYASAELVQSLVRKFLVYESPEDILVLTPFRAQRTVLRAMLRGLKVTVSTVHRAQGSERRTIIFDPVDGGSNFLLNDESKRLINVALSRAKARLLLIFSEFDFGNPLFQEIAALAGQRRSARPVTAIRAATVVRPASHAGEQTVEVAQYAKRPDFPACLLGKTVQWSGAIGKVIGATAEQFTIQDHLGEVRSFSVSFIRSRLR